MSTNDYFIIYLKKSSQGHVQCITKIDIDGEF